MLSAVGATAHPPPPPNPPHLESQGCHLISLSYLLFCFSAFYSYFLFLVIFLLVVHSPDFPPKILKHFSLQVWRLCLNIVEQLRDDSRWYLQLAAIWHWYLPLCIYIILMFFKIVSCFCPFLVYIFIQSGISKLDRVVDDTSMP